MSLFEHRLKFGVMTNLPNLLSTTACDRDLGGPLKRLHACGHVDNRDSSDGLRLWTFGNSPICCHDARPLIPQSTGDYVYTSVDDLLDYGASSLGNFVHNLVGKVIHRVGTE